MIRKKIFFAAAVLCGFLAASQAHAWFKFCSQYPSTTWVAFEWLELNCSDGGDWRKKGWWRLEPGECKIVFGADLQSLNTYYYYYAEAADGAFWAGPYPDCVPYQRFDWCTNTCNSSSRDVGFREIYIGSYNNYTLTLVP